MRTITILGLLAAGLGWPTSAVADNPIPRTARDSECFICHAGTGDARAPKIDLVAYRASVHALHGCISCHGDVEDVSIAHDKEDEDLRPVDCAHCHLDERVLAEFEARAPAPAGSERGHKVDLVRIIREFDQSVHSTKSVQFTCARCHDPHRIRFGMTPDESLEHNQACLRCHGSELEFRTFAHRAPPDLDAAHQWLPNRDLHWRSVRCVDCHTNSEGVVGSHRILPKAQALSKCESCHQEASVLKFKTYRYAHAVEQEKYGFMNAAILNEAYVIGATRNQTLDLIGMSLATLTFLGILGHALLRTAAALVRRKRGIGPGGPHP
ncbi:MAG: hypothetical protein IPG45_25815 [Deltaproteobacteria bacterium]|nr:hypothetical protein [Deltaproteobacteria bacterium]